MAAYDRFTTADLDFEIEKRAVDTLVVGFCDLQGRLVARRVTTDFFMSEVVPHGMRVPAYLLATDATGSIAPGFPLASVDTGYRDLILRVDLASLFRIPWQPGSIGVLGDLEFLDGTAVTMSPRTILRRQAQRAEDSSFTATIGIEPQFTIFAEPHDQPDAVQPRPVGALGGNHLATRSGRAEKTMHRIRVALQDMPVPIEGSAGLLAPGHYEITLRPADPMHVCDSALTLGAAVKDITADDGWSASFMACPEEGAGSASHVNVSLRGLRGGMALSDRHGEAGLSEVGKAFVAGQLEHAAELCLLFAPNVNSYRRLGSDPLAPSAINWGDDNRTCAVRVTGNETALRVENRIPGSDANPYLAAAAVLAAGIDGIAHQARLAPGIQGDGHSAGSPALPASLADALAAWESSSWVRGTFGPEVQDHYAAAARAELAAFESVGGIEAERARYLDGC